MLTDRAWRVNAKIWKTQNIVTIIIPSILMFQMVNFQRVSELSNIFGLSGAQGVTMSVLPFVCPTILVSVRPSGTSLSEALNLQSFSLRSVLAISQLT